MYVCAVYVLDPNRRKELIETYIRKPKYSVRRVQLLCEVSSELLTIHTYIHIHLKPLCITAVLVVVYMYVCQCMYVCMIFYLRYIIIIIVLLVLVCWFSG